MSEIGAARLAEAHRRLLADGAIQFDLPPYVPPQPPTWLEPLARFLRWISPAFPYLFWTIVAVGGAIILLLIVRELLGARWSLPWRRKAGDEDAEDWRPTEEAARALLEEAERLAAEGRYAEATHLLLQRSVEDITKRHPGLVRPSVTARDLAAAPALPDRARNAFAAIARVVEASLFGGRAVDAAGWAACRSAYANFALAASWS
jgi:hypothetical protein